MAQAQVHIEMTADGKPIEALQDLIAKRIQHTNESAKQALAACAIDILKSVRAITLVARPQDVVISCNASLVPSFFIVGKKKIPCLRYKGSRARFYPQGQKIIWASNGVKFSMCQVYQFTD